jgi:hypothetical protein
MKISPVLGTPTLPQTPATGLSPEKLERLKAIAEGKTPEEAAQDPEVAKPALDTTQRIKMNVNRTVNRDGDLPIEAAADPKGGEIPPPPGKEESNPDIDVQTKIEPEAIKPISPQLAELARQRRALQAKERELADKEKALEGKPTADGLIERLKKQPLSVLLENGVTYDQLTNEILSSQQGNAEVAALKAQIADLEKGIDERFTKKESEQEQAVFNHIKKNVDSLSFSSEDFKFIRERKAQGDVMRLIKEAWYQKGDVLDEEEAMKLVETELREEARLYAKLIGELERPAQTPPQPAANKQGIKTITNKDAARPVMDRKKRAIAAMLGQR